MLSKDLLKYKNDKVFIIGRGIFDSTAEKSYVDSELLLRAEGFSSIRHAAMYPKPVDPNDQTDWMRWVGRELLSADILFIIVTDREVRRGPLELFIGYEWCRELAHSVKIPVFYKEYEVHE